MTNPSLAGFGTAIAATQGHYWAHCQATKTLRDFHLCCAPDNCELEAAP